VRDSKGASEGAGGAIAPMCGRERWATCGLDSGGGREGGTPPVPAARSR
jgi:hypothetical protein